LKDNQIPQMVEPNSASLQNQTNRVQRILVVDDEPLICHLNLKNLSEAGYQADAAEDGAAAWNALQLNNYDLIITDNTMPRMTGIQMIEKMHTAGLTVPVIMASGTLPKEKLTPSPMLQPIATLPKPYSAKQLLEMVKKVLGETGP
jgi:two-component system alkaline phosphatase synthesis response regulator PhoP